MIGLKDAALQVPEIKPQWSGALPMEVGFWNLWLGSHGATWKEDYAQRIDPNVELQWHVKPYVLSKPGSTARILDVGAGPLTVLGKKWTDRTLDITAVDPLAEDYDRILADAGITPVVRTIKGEAERVAEQFAENSFDFVYAQNCIDHCLNPLKAIDQMLKVVKPGHFVMLEHAVNEGKSMAYDGLHQWNFCIENKRFTIWRPYWKTDAHAIFEPIAEIEAREKDNWMIVALKKK